MSGHSIAYERHYNYGARNITCYALVQAVRQNITSNKCLQGRMERAPSKACSITLSMCLPCDLVYAMLAIAGQ